MNNFEVSSTACRSDGEASDRLFVGEVTQHNAERPWLVIRGVASPAVVTSSEQVAKVSPERI